MPEIDSRKLRSYYDRFYKEGDFRYYSEELSTTMLRTLLEKLRLQPGSSILDVGCGTGYYAELLSKLGMRTTGVDVSISGLHKARMRYTALPLVCGDANLLPFRKEEFSAAFLFGCSLMNTANNLHMYRLLSESAFLVRAGGWIVATSSSDFSGKTKGGWLQHLPDDFRRVTRMFGESRSFLWITHPRLFALRGLALHRLVQTLLRLTPLRFPRMIICAIQKPEAGSSENWENS